MYGAPAGRAATGRREGKKPARHTRALLEELELTEEHALVLSIETLRGWMSAAGLWVPRAQRTRRSYPPRARRACLGEHVQIDGSDHAWFEDRRPRCTLLVYVDDATSRREIYTVCEMAHDRRRPGAGDLLHAEPP